MQYVSGKLAAAVSVLATDPGRIQERLGRAAMELTAAAANGHVDAYWQGELDALLEQLRARLPSAPAARSRSAADLLSDGEAVAVAVAVVALEYRLRDAGGELGGI